MHHGAQRHAPPGHVHFRHFARITARHATTDHSHPREIHSQFDPTGLWLEHCFAEQFAQPRLLPLQLVRWAIRMMGTTAVRHALDDELPMARHVHLDPARNAQAARPFGRVIDGRQRVLKLRLVGADNMPLDGKTLAVHGAVQTSSSSSCANVGLGRGNSSRTALRSPMPRITPT